MKNNNTLHALIFAAIVALILICFAHQSYKENQRKQDYIYTLVDTAALRREGIILPPHALDAQWFNIVKFQQQLDAIRKIRKHEN